MYIHLFTLKVFCSVVEKGSVAKAAEELLLTQPAVSLQIKNLENLYDTSFFDRTPKGLKVNEQGKFLYKYAKKMTEFHSEMYREVLNHTRKHLQQEMRIAASTVPGIYFLPSILRSYKEKYSTNFHFEVSETGKILEKMEKGKIDIAVVSHVINTKGIQHERLLRHPLCVVSPKGYIQATNQHVNLKDLEGKDIILMKEGCDITKAWKSFLERYHIKLEQFHVTGVFDHISDIIRFLKEGVGLGVLPECVIGKEIENGVLERLRIKESGLYITFFLAFRRTSLQNKNVHRFYKFLKSSNLSALKSSTV
jgi:DNA-binding transcriptional LysR family regulator